MKRKSIAAIILALCLMCFGSAFALESADVIGTWYLSEIGDESSSINPALIGMEMSMTINEDGTAELSTKSGENEYTDKATWAIDGDALTVTDATDTASTLTLENGVLIGTDAGTRMVFSKEKAEVSFEAYIPAAQKTGVTAEDFAGKWTVTIAGTSGTQLPINALGMQVTITVDGQNAIYSYNMNGAGSETALTAALENDVLVLKSGDVAVLELKLLEDGILTYGDSTGATVFYAEKSAE